MPSWLKLQASPCFKTKICPSSLQHNCCNQKLTSLCQSLLTSLKLFNSCEDLRLLNVYQERKKVMMTILTTLWKSILARRFCKMEIMNRVLPMYVSFWMVKSCVL
jgi:hypothetical protein